MIELIDNVNKTLKDDLSVSIQKDSKVSIAAACFSIYAFQELKRELKNIEELRFIFTFPTISLCLCDTILTGFVNEESSGIK